MTYETPVALRSALERRLLNKAEATGVALDRLRRRVIFERVMARLEAAEPGCWVLKGGMALEVRLEDDARLTKDLDLGLRGGINDRDELHDRLIAALASDPHQDRFELTPATPELLSADGARGVTWRVSVAERLAGKAFGGIKLDISPRPNELTATDRLPLPNSLDFAGVPTTTVEVVDVHRHAAEKLHAMVRTFGTIENSRVRDLVDIVLLLDRGLLDAGRLRAVVIEVWRQREGCQPASTLPPFPVSWRDRYEKTAGDLGLTTASFDRAESRVVELWASIFDTEGA